MFCEHSCKLVEMLMLFGYEKVVQLVTWIFFSLQPLSYLLLHSPILFLATHSTYPNLSRCKIV
jgi:hypothetical protein